MRQNACGTCTTSLERTTVGELLRNPGFLGSLGIPMPSNLTNGFTVLRHRGNSCHTREEGDTIVKDSSITAVPNCLQESFVRRSFGTAGFTQLTTSSAFSGVGVNLIDLPGAPAAAVPIGLESTGWKQKNLVADHAANREGQCLHLLNPTIRTKLAYNRIPVGPAPIPFYAAQDRGV